MTPYAAQVAAFYRDITRTRVVFAVRDDEGFPAPRGTDGQRAMPFWSTRSRAERIVSSVPAFLGMTIVEIRLADFMDRWLPGLEADGLAVGINWSGDRASGFDYPAKIVLAQLDSG